MSDGVAGGHRFLRKLWTMVYNHSNHHDPTPLDTAIKRGAASATQDP